MTKKQKRDSLIVCGLFVILFVVLYLLHVFFAPWVSAVYTVILLMLPASLPIYRKQTMRKKISKVAQNQQFRQWAQDHVGVTARQLDDFVNMNIGIPLNKLYRLEEEIDKNGY